MWASSIDAQVCEPPHLPEAIWFKLSRHGGLLQHGVVALLGFGRRDVADGLQQPPIVEPVHPFQGRELDGLEAAPWSAPMDHLGLVKAVDGFGESIVIGIADAPDRGLDAGFGQALGVFDRDILGGFKRSSQHQLFSLMTAIRQALLPAFSSLVPGIIAE